ncbi:V-type_proton ATPase proteolipid subunit [Hexamita inflata]|uniref:V-type proton ATPase proteolipid subunit n=1 Tax=Hexamita inflata TaxID=28002 RepID=A0AA86RBW6_9EUKA|nr:V-type proton ATPase proteolipid subunit [Hexamita inflata]CAI9930865.1 V-type proton ATPase proteolipid subunit [Hexamita inflata]CAI9933547.1 V-type proton ATPase proteolipid subunit [Hexamita inflata]CAI9969694.1 V-type proton ATPase proteolipid subunit [Hexamita inflata]CAI9971679.1 V-type proton ATPase proteolipid subunit [Hexamita inflata]
MDAALGFGHSFEKCPMGGSFWSFFGMFFSVTFASFGSAFGTAKAGAGMATGGLINPGPLTKLTLPVIMAGVLSIYGLITMLVINAKVQAYPLGMPLYIGYAHFAAGICTGLASLSAGLAIGIAGQSASKCVAQQPSLFVVMIIVMIFGEALALFGLIVSLLLTSINIDATACESL